MPRTADPASGRIYQLKVNHGTLVYVNKQEFAFASNLFGVTGWLGPMLAVVLLWLNIKYNPFKKGPNKVD